jgi:drug/metabolite transporter (DMT)-like permease
MSAATWGGSDFVGGIGARRAPALLVVASGHIFSLIVLLALCLAIHVALPGSHYLLFAALGGFEGSLALAIFYRALAMGAMGLTAALTGLLTALVPVIFSLFHDGLPTPLTAGGLALGLVAIWLITHTPESKNSATGNPETGTPSTPPLIAEELNSDSQRCQGTTLQVAEKLVALKGHDFSRAVSGLGSTRALAPEGPASPNSHAIRASTPAAALLLGALAGCGFGTQLILFKFASPGGMMWVMTSARAAGVAAMLLVLVVMPPTRPWRGFWITGIAAGLLDTIGNLFYLQATRFGRLDVAALICSLYPAGTILLAALVLREWPTRRQLAGIAVALTAVALLGL